MDSNAARHRIKHLDLFEKNRPIAPNHLRREQQTALSDILKDGTFRPADNDNGPYGVSLSIEDGRLVLRIKDSADDDVNTLVLSLRPYRRILTDYFMMIESYEQMRRTGSREKLEAIDMGRRGLHNEGAALLQSRLKNHVEMDFETARRFFTLICVLHGGTVRMGSTNI